MVVPKQILNNESDKILNIICNQENASSTNESLKQSLKQLKNNEIKNLKADLIKTNLNVMLGGTVEAETNVVSDVDPSDNGDEVEKNIEYTLKKVENNLFKEDSDNLFNCNRNIKIYEDYQKLLKKYIFILR